MSIALFPPTKCWYEFGPFRLDVEERVLQCHGTPVALPPKVFDTLAVLVENSGRLLEKDELIRTLWPDSFVEDGSLARKISYLRKALEEYDPAQRYIETVPKIGYRFVAEVKTVPLKASANGAEAIVFPPPLPNNDNGIWTHNEVVRSEVAVPLGGPTRVGWPGGQSELCGSLL